MKYARYVVFISIVFILSSSLFQNVMDYKKKYDFYQRYKQDYEKEKQTNTALKTEIRKEDSQTELEKTIRNKLNLLKPNETSIMVPTPTPSPVVITPTPAPNWKQWINLFFK